MFNPEDIIAMTLDEAMKKLNEFTDIRLVQTDANFALSKKLDKSQYSMARVVRADVDGNTITILYDMFKEF